MTTKLRIITLNLCLECGDNKFNIAANVMSLLSKWKGDVIIFQEIEGYNLTELAKGLDMQILNTNHKEHTCVFINPKKLAVIDKYHVRKLRGQKPIFIGAVHLDDVPALPHHMHMMLYVSDMTLSLNYTLDQIIELCKIRRLPRLRKELARANDSECAIIAGDYNEPSHYDLKGIMTPCSVLMAKKGYVDTYKYMHPNRTGYTWPNKEYYEGEPKQRIDYIYTRGMKVEDSRISGDSHSDHKMVISDVIV
jgi:endonuclease/exonuclease/phosphatase family metal-dependent hydrolase